MQRLTEALRFALSPEASLAAMALARQMKQEDGIGAAVRSFHRWLPLEKMQCQIDPSQAARWLLTLRGKPQIRVSDAAASSLLAKKKIKLDCLHP